MGKLDGSKWTFEGFVPDWDDSNAAFQTLQRLLELERQNPVFSSGIDWFTAGFNRGCRWMQDKLEVQEENEG